MILTGGVRLVIGRIFRRGVAAGVVSALAIGIPTDVISTPLFSRMTPVRWWEPPVLVATSVLTALWFSLPEARGSGRGSRISVANVFSMLAVGCPVCNKLVVAALGVSGALAIWAPVQPLLGGLSVGLILFAVVTRWRLSALAPPLPVDASGDGLVSSDAAGSHLAPSMTGSGEFRGVERNADSQPRPSGSSEASILLRTVGQRLAWERGIGEDRSLWPLEGWGAPEQVEAPAAALRLVAPRVGR